jgi:imidazole glycerol-phosphate synthase subunit HisH
VIVVADYGAGNLHSIGMGLRRQGLEVRVTDDPRALDGAAALVVPGDGAFGPAIAELRRLGFADRIVEYIGSGRPFLGICLGMQLLFDESSEGGPHRGLGVLPGRVVRLPAAVKVPHMGWNQLRVERPSPLLDGIASGAYVYFVHSYHCVSRDPALVAASASYGTEIAAVAGAGNVWATQFHPEKSGTVGERMLRNFARWTAGVGAAGG